MQPYSPEVEQQMQRFYGSLSEKDRRCYAAIEALKLGWGGISYINHLFGCDDETIGFWACPNLKSINLIGVPRTNLTHI